MRAGAGKFVVGVGSPDRIVAAGIKNNQDLLHSDLLDAILDLGHVDRSLFKKIDVITHLQSDGSKNAWPPRSIP